jgi:diacylglycerol kinase family enzyme
VEDARSQDRAAPANPPPSGQAVFIGNGRFYGGSFRLFPDARLDDGRLDICILERCRPGRLARFSLGLLRGGHVRLPDVRYFQSTAFTCAAADAVPLELDGEDAGDGPVTFSVLPRALRVVVP